MALLPKEADKASHIAKGLKLSRKQQRAIGERLLAAQKSNESGPETSLADIRGFAYRTGVDSARDAALLFADDTALPGLLEALEGWQPPVFPLTGGDLIAQGLKPGPLVAKTLAKIETAWIAQGFPDEAWIRKFIKEQALTRQP
ncbi:hypothetical protein [Sphingopyxis sp. BSNA05]|uniref:hypothetical protein n=1 Tax=Sphingopyxis sp. BSNA05 TaxID=1236614 RepID=UPI00349F3620